MKIFILTLLIASAFTVKLNLSANPIINDLNNFFTLSTSQAQGAVTYSCQGLPQGIILSGNQLVYSGSVGLQGQFPVKITATDAQGQSDTQIILLNVNLSGKGTVTYPSANSQKTVETILSSISTNSPGSISSSSSSSSSSLSSTSSSSSITTSSSTSGSNLNTGSSSGGAQILTVNGVDYNLGNSLNLNLNSNNGNFGTIGGSISSTNTPSPGYINNLVSQYGQNITLASVSSKNITSYPTTVVLPGRLPNAVPNTQIITIGTANAAKGNQPINKLSEYDVNITNLFNQQTEVTQTIANLLEIIRQGSANRQQAQADINSYTTSLNSAVISQQQLSATITQEQVKVKNIQSAIDGANNQLGTLNGQLTKLNSDINSAKTTGLGLTQQLSVALNNQDGIKSQISITNTTITNINATINSQSQTCSQANQAILIIKGNITGLLNSIAGIDQKVAGIDNNIKDYNNQIAALQAQINALNAKIAQANTDKQTLINLNYTVPQQVANLNAQISAQQATCQNTYSPDDLTKAQNQLSTLLQQLNVANNQIDGINSNITAVKGQLTDLLNQNAQLNQQISKTQSDLSTLKQQLPQQQANLANLYVQGNQALQNVQSLNSSLQVAVARYKKQSDALTIANVNLQTARSRQQKISNSINLILQENTAGLPFPSAPGESGLTNALATINNIDSISAYLLSAYGSQLNFNILSGFFNLRQLYNFGGSINIKSNCPEIILSASAAAAQNQTNYNLYSGLGTITKVVSGNNVVVNTNQGSQTLNLDVCSIKLANIPNYSLNVGDVLVWKGAYDANSSAWNANQVTCFH